MKAASEKSFPQPDGQVLAALKSAGSAEDFFTLLGVPFDPKVLQTARLHILKRMGEYLAGDDLEGMPDPVVAARCKAVLERAYGDFVTSTPLQERVFKVLKQAVEPPPPEPFVPLDRLFE
ncbi:MAG: nitrogenase stabilizing/protective protein NifW [Xanthobacteraceae bacterium]